MVDRYISQSYQDHKQGKQSRKRQTQSQTPVVLLTCTAYTRRECHSYRCPCDKPPIELQGSLEPPPHIFCRMNEGQACNLQFKNSHPFHDNVKCELHFCTPDPKSFPVLWASRSVTSLEAVSPLASAVWMARSDQSTVFGFGVYPLLVTISTLPSRFSTGGETFNWIFLNFPSLF